MSLFERVAAAFREPGAADGADGDATEGTADGGGRPVSNGSDDPSAGTDGGDAGEGAAADGRSGSDDDGPADDETTDAVVAVCQRAPEGVRTYTLDVEAEGAEVVEVTPGVLEAHFEVIEGGVGHDSVRVRAVDFRGEARRVEAETLVGVRFAAPVPLPDVRMRLVSAEDHDGDTLPSEWFRIASVS
ncbi:hypothetical protein BRC97_01345 [Halobacteriales archaeon QS_6_71_20]|nr:MAG: hypothetical protein BRC97_01345 [Halobacteriales archaeon QS_6_71_20]